MADGNGAAVHVQLVHWDAEAIAAINYLHRKCFVEFPEIDIVNFQALALKQFGDGEYRADAHLVGFATGDLEAAKNQLIRDTELIGAFARHEESGGSSVGKLRGV